MDRVGPHRPDEGKLGEGLEECACLAPSRLVDGKVELSVLVVVKGRAGADEHVVDDRAACPGAATGSADAYRPLPEDPVDRAGKERERIDLAQAVRRRILPQPESGDGVRLPA